MPRAVLLSATYSLAMLRNVQTKSLMTTDGQCDNDNRK